MFHEKNRRLIPEPTLSNLHRIQWIDMEIRSDKYPNCRKIAEKFEISRRQAMRDIEYLRDSLNAPVEFSHEKNGYYYSERTFAVPNLLMTDNDRRMLALLSEKYKSTKSGASLEIARLFDRLSGLKEDAGESSADTDRIKRIDDAVLFELEAAEIANILPMRDALENKRKLEFEYLNGGNVRSRRIVHPYKLLNRDSFVYLLAFCELRNNLRIFRCGRMTNVLILPEKFDALSENIISGFLNNGAFNFRKPYEAGIKFIGGYDRDSLSKTFMTRTDVEDGDVLRVEFFKSEELIMSLLSMKKNFTVLSPSWLRNKLKDKLADLARLNDF
jgi:predicted DNA-binding transcriptional regulator YafY